MSHARLLDMQKKIAGALDQGTAVPRKGIVQSFDPVNYLAKVELQPEGVLTGWLEINVLTSGGMAILAPPSLGQQVTVIFDNGDHENGIIMGATFSAEDMPPQPANAFGGKGVQGTTPVPVQAGELAIVGQSAGARFMPTGVYSWGAWNHDGPLVVNGDLSDEHGSLNTLRQHYDAHQHTSEPAGTPTSPPLTPNIDPE